MAVFGKLAVRAGWIGRQEEVGQDKLVCVCSKRQRCVGCIVGMCRVVCMCGKGKAR